MKLETMWCVTDPMPGSEIGDICFEVTPKQLVASIAGAVALGEEQVRLMQSMAVYTERLEARRDAVERLRRRDEAAR